MGFLSKKFNKSREDNNIPTLEDDTEEINHIKDEYIEDGAFHFTKDNGEDISINIHDFTMPMFTVKGTVDNMDKLSEIEGKLGEVYVDASTNNIYTWIDNQWMLMSNCETEESKHQVHKRTKKIIPYPSHCKSCGSALHGYVCEYCHTEYPSFEYIIEEESY
jgi:hypothetical protein